MSRSDDTFLGRWSRKKLEPEVELVDETPQEAEATPDETLTDEEILEQLELPDPDQLKEGDDFAAFMNSAVPDHLRKRALRKLWLSNPALANLDGLLEYGEDYTDAAMVPEVLNTAYKVGRGFLKDVLADAPEEDVPEQEMPVAEDQSDEEPDVADPRSVDAENSDATFEVAETQEARHIPRTRMVFSTE